MDSRTIGFRRDPETGTIIIAFGADLAPEAAEFITHLACYLEERSTDSEHLGTRFQQTKELWRFAAHLEKPEFGLHMDFDTPPDVDQEICNRYCPWISKGKHA